MNHEFTPIPGHLASTAFSARSLLRGLPADARRSFSQIGQTRRLGRFETAISERQTPALFVLHEGRAETVYFNRLNRRFIFTDVQPLEMIGLTETILNTPFRITLKTVTPCSMQTIEKPEFMCFLEMYPNAGFKLCEILGADICESSILFASVTFKN